MLATKSGADCIQGKESTLASGTLLGSASQYGVVK